MKWHKKLIFACICSVSVSLFGQTHEPVDSIFLPSVTIVAERDAAFSAGIKTTSIDAKTLEESGFSLAEVLAQNSSVFVKNYGQGGLASVSFRGTGAEHTALIWRGMTLNSPSLGLTDLSLFPSFLLENASIHHGSTTSFYGSSAIGGSIHLGRSIIWDKKIYVKIRQQIGSFGDYRSGLDVKIGNAKVQSRTAGYYQQAANDYPFPGKNRPLSVFPLNQSHAAFRQWGLLQDLDFSLPFQQTLSLGLWYQNSLREIPPPYTVARSTATQQDSVLRLSFEWKKRVKKGQYVARAGYSEEFINYQDSDHSISDQNHSRLYFAETEFRRNFFEHLFLTAGFSYNRMEGFSTNYEKAAAENRFSLFAAARYEVLSWLQFSGSLRKDLVNRPGFSTKETPQPPLVPAIGFEIGLPKISSFPGTRLRIKGNASRNYNLPTLNQRFWSPGGNPEIQPESGWSGDVGLVWDHFFARKTASYFKVEVTHFQSLINNWIQWQPLGGTVWSPVNLRQVWARGLESTLNFHSNWGKWSFEAGGSYAFTRSTNTRIARGYSSSALGKQLIYVPIHNANLKLRADFRGYFFQFEQTLTGKRFTSFDNVYFLPAYTLGNLCAGKTWTLKIFTLGTQIRVTNLWNLRYQPIAGRIMPGTGVYGQLDFGFTHLFKKTIK